MIGNDNVMMRAMYGQHAKHVPCWMIAQDQGEGVTLFVGASRSLDLRFGSARTHVLMLGEMIARPHLVLASDAFRGAGIASLARGPDVAEWVKGDLLADPLGRFSELKR